MESSSVEFEYLRSGEGEATTGREEKYHKAITLFGALCIPIVGRFFRLPGPQPAYSEAMVNIRWLFSLAFAAMFIGSVTMKKARNCLYRCLVAMYHVITVWIILIGHVYHFPDHYISMLAIAIAIEFNLFKRMKDIVSFSILTLPVAIILRVYGNGDLYSKSYFVILFSILYAFMAWAQYQKIKIMQGLEISRSLSTTILDRAGDALLLLDRREFTVVYSNNSSSALLDVPDAKSIAGRTCGDVLALPGLFDNKQDILTAVYREGAWMKEVDLTSRDGSRFHADLVIREVLLGGMGYLLLRITDITSKHRAEERFQRQAEHLQQIQKHEALGKLAAGVAHELNNPLTVILGFAQGMIKRVDNPKWEEPLKNIEREARRARDLVEHLMVFSRDSIPQREQPVGVNKCVKRVLDLLKGTLRKYRIEIVANTSDDLPMLRNAREVDVSQVILNLCHNTIDAMKDGGILTVTTKQENVSGNSGVVIEICDTGSGIPEKYRKRIFEPFFTTKEEGRGSGLGLAVVFNRVESMGGTIEAMDRNPEGTCMRVILPVDRNHDENQET